MQKYEDFDESTRRFDVPRKQTIRQKAGHTFMAFSYYASVASLARRNEQPLNRSDFEVDDIIASRIGTAVLVSSAVIADVVTDYTLGVSPLSIAYEAFTLQSMR